MRVTLVLDDGEYRHVGTLYVKKTRTSSVARDALDNEGWTVVQRVVAAGRAKIGHTNASLLLGGLTGHPGQSPGRYYAFVLKNGIAGRTIVNLDLTTVLRQREFGTLVDRNGNRWAVLGAK